MRELRKGLRLLIEGRDPVELLMRLFQLMIGAWLGWLLVCTFLVMEPLG